MSSPRPEAGAQPIFQAAGAGAGDDPFNTALITRLAKDLFAGVETPAALPGGPAPSVPAGLAGVPGALPGAPSAPDAIPAISSRGAEDQSLAGGFSPVAAPTHPPVKPVLEPAEL